MSKNYMEIGEAYYTTVGKKDIEGIKSYLHPAIQFKSPIMKVNGKEAVLEAITNFTNFFKTLTIRAKCGSQDQAVIVYDVEFPAPIGSISTAALMTFQEGLISKLELFFDTKPFEKK